MDYKNYRISRDLAWDILLREGICELPIKTSVLCRNMGITLAYGNPEHGSDGYSTFVSGSMYIVIQAGLPVARTRFTVAHEIGHILLGHVGKYRLVNREPSGTDSPIEHEANIFASRLLAPACVLWGCGVQSAEDIAALCGISLQSAQIRAERMALLTTKNKFLTSSAEQQVYRQFSPFICSHRLQVSNYPTFA